MHSSGEFSPSKKRAETDAMRSNERKEQNYLVLARALEFFFKIP